MWCFARRWTKGQWAVSPGRWHARVEMLSLDTSLSNGRLSLPAAACDQHPNCPRATLVTQRTQTAQAVARYFPPGKRL